MGNKFSFIIFLLISGVLVFLVTGGVEVFAEKDGGVVIFKNTKSMRPVLFSHQKHLDVGNTCESCHERIFKKKKGSSSPIKMMDMRKGKYCGSCHNGSKAFTVKHSCSKCHSAPR
ncbi:MAG: cytochrome c3 family protein [Nitrospinales bacterium]